MHEPKQLPAVIENNQLDAEAVDAAAEAILQRLRRFLRNPAREIRTLRWSELRLLAIDCISAFIVKRSKQRTIAELDDLLESCNPAPSILN